MNEKSTRKWKQPTQLILSDEFKQHMEARMKSEDGKRLSTSSRVSLPTGPSSKCRGNCSKGWPLARARKSSR
jgi:hypothetical protein